MSDLKDKTPSDVLEYRVSALERTHQLIADQLKNLIEKQEVRYEALSIKLDTAIRDMRSHACPTPGACASLMRDVTELTKVIDRVEKMAVKHEEQIAELRTTAAEGKVSLKVSIFWVGILSSVIGSLAALIVPIIAK